MIETRTKKIYECTCTDFGHVFRVETWFDNDMHPEFFLEFGLNEDAGFFKRTWIAIKYIFTGRSYLWDVVLSEKQMRDMQSQLEKQLGKKPNRKVRK